MPDKKQSTTIHLYCNGNKPQKLHHRDHHHHRRHRSIIQINSISFIIWFCLIYNFLLMTTKTLTVAVKITQQLNANFISSSSSSSSRLIVESQLDRSGSVLFHSSSSSSSSSSYSDLGIQTNNNHQNTGVDRKLSSAHSYIGTGLHNNGMIQQQQQQQPKSQQQQQQQHNLGHSSGNFIEQHNNNNHNNPRHSNQDSPYFDDVSPKNVSAVIGDTVILKCRVKNKGNRTVSWMRKRDLHILTSNLITYTGDQRFTIQHQTEMGDWDLRILYVQERDTGIYECQVNIEPKINWAIALEVTAARAQIFGAAEIHVNAGSTISLSCTVNVHASSMKWYHGPSPIDFDSPRGGVSLEIEKTESGTSSRLMLVKAEFRDSGNYTCLPTNAVSASIQVHVAINGEHPAAMQGSSHLQSSNIILLFILYFILLLITNEMISNFQHFDQRPPPPPPPLPLPSFSSSSLPFSL